MYLSTLAMKVTNQRTWIMKKIIFFQHEWLLSCIQTLLEQVDLKEKKNFRKKENDEKSNLFWKRCWCSRISELAIQVEISKKVLFSVRIYSDMFYFFHNSIGTIQRTKDKKKTSTKTRTFLKKAQNHLGISLYLFNTY